MRWIQKTQGALEAEFYSDEVVWYITQIRGDIYVTTASSQSRNITDLVPEHEIINGLRRARLSKLRLSEAPFGDLPCRP
jgi:hypothetical protein